MKSAITCLILIVATMFFLIVVLFFRDKFLFFLSGYDYEMTRSTSVESFKAHAEIQKWRLALFGLTFLIGAACFIVCRNMERVAENWYYTAGKFLGIITCILMIVILVIYIVLPKRLI